MPASLLVFRRICWLGVVIWVVTVFILSSLPGPEVAELNVLDVWDKALHFAAFFCGALALLPALRLTCTWSWKRTILTGIAALSLYGALDEFHQSFTPSRSALDPGDWSADTLGAAAGTLLAAFVYARVSRKNQPAPPGA